MVLTAEHVAVAIVTACREMGEGALAVAEQRKPQSRARHYALQALRTVFPKVQRDRLAFLCGCAGNPEFYAANSARGMARFVGGPHKGERIHRFWNEAVFERIIASIRESAPTRERDVEIEATPDAPPRRAPVKLSARIDSIVEPTRPSAVPGKRKLEQMLHDAVSNTQRMTPPPEPQPNPEE